MTRFVCALLAALVLTSCRADPHSAVIPNDPAQWDKDFGERIKDLDQEEKQLVGEYLLRVKLGEVFGGAGIPPGTTVSDALQQQREFKARQLVTATVLAQRNVESTATAIIVAQQRAAATATAQALRDQLAQERARVITAFSNALTVTMVSKEYIPAGTERFQFSDRAHVTLGMRNNSEQAIQTFRGTVRLADQFD